MTRGLHSFLEKQAIVWLVKRGFSLAVDEVEVDFEGRADALGIGKIKDELRLAVVEVKTSRSDFKRDAKKQCRAGGNPVTTERWFMAPKGLLQPGEIPAGWGLLEYDAESNSTHVKKRSPLKHGLKRYWDHKWCLVGSELDLERYRRAYVCVARRLMTKFLYNKNSGMSWQGNLLCYDAEELENFGTE